MELLPVRFNILAMPNISLDEVVKALMEHFDHLESVDPDKSFENWKQYKFIRNNIRECLASLKEEPVMCVGNHPVGEIEPVKSGKDERTIREWENCARCTGTGQIRGIGGGICLLCRGSGRVIKREEVTEE